MFVWRWKRTPTHERIIKIACSGFLFKEDNGRTGSTGAGRTGAPRPSELSRFRGQICLGNS